MYVQENNSGICLEAQKSYGVQLQPDYYQNWIFF